MNKISHPILGIDYGKKRIGIAITDKEGILAHPFKTLIVGKENPFFEIQEIVEKRKIQAIVIGLPFSLDGSENKMMRAVKIFAEKLKSQIPQIPIHYNDERFSSQTAIEKLKENPKFKMKTKERIDRAAAVEILQNWLEENENKKETI